MLNLKKIISSIADAGQKLFKKKDIKKNDLCSILSLCDDFNSGVCDVLEWCICEAVETIQTHIGLPQKLKNISQFSFPLQLVTWQN